VNRKRSVVRIEDGFDVMFALSRLVVGAIFRSLR
jgi:hypothetical protein